MDFTLMNRNVELLDVSITRGVVQVINNIREDCRHLLPIPLVGKKPIETFDFFAWWSKRRMPASRDGLAQAIFNLQQEERDWSLDVDGLLEESLSLSLSDTYWLRPCLSMKWEDVNYFTNNFSDDIGELLLTGEWSKGSSFSSPDITGDGLLKKRWKIIGGKRYLLKGSSSTFIIQPQPFREVFASKIASILTRCMGSELAYVDYGLMLHKNVVYSKCQTFVTEKSEYVPMFHIRDAFLREGLSPIEEFTWIRKLYGISSVLLDLTLILDYIILNTDRHFGNFGFLRDSTTGQITGFAPIFDNGNSLFYNSLDLEADLQKARPYYSNFEEIFSFVNVSRYSDVLLAVRDSLADIFWPTFEGCFESQERLSGILDVVCKRLDVLIKATARR